jgi:hypothetical protein
MAKFVKFCLALILLPVVVSSARLLADCLQQTASWPTHELTLLAAGALLAALAFIFLPRPTWFYVFGHETTHALAVWCSGGKVKGFKVSSKGGHVLADRISPLIALSPYIFPFYPFLVLLLWWPIESIWPGAAAFRDAFWVVWGLSWGFHLAFTLSVMKTAQPDFASQGYLFSFVCIALGNLWLILILLWFWLQPFSWQEGFARFSNFTVESYRWVWQTWAMGIRWIHQQLFFVFA